MSRPLAKTNLFMSPILTLLLIAGCQSNQPGSSEAEAIPKDVTYTIVKTDIIPGIKRSLDVRLNRKVSEDMLRSIAMELKNADRNEYDRTFIAYYLPGMKVGAGGWATTHFNPDLRVTILGFTADQPTTVASEPDSPSRELIGKWLAEAYVRSRITIYRENGKLYVEHKFKDGSALNKGLVKRASSRGQRFEQKEVSPSGDYYLIDRQGNLEIRDQDGLIETAKKID